jgi:hypothetical protein
MESMRPKDTVLSQIPLADARTMCFLFLKRTSTGTLDRTCNLVSPLGLYKVDTADPPAVQSMLAPRDVGIKIAVGEMLTSSRLKHSPADADSNRLERASTANK